jgi:2-keto-4-pentenoate hydratase
MPGTEVVPPSQTVGAGETKMEGGRRVRGATAKDLKKMLKKAGLKTTGRKAALTRRAKKAHLKIRGGVSGQVVEGPATQAGGSALSPHPYGGMEGGKRRSRRKASRGYKLF